MPLGVLPCQVATAGAAGDALAKYKVHIEHTSMLGRRRRPKKADGAIDFLATATIHCFPVPSAPLNVRVVSRTLSSLTASWEPPGYWGGCALASYEMELREISGKGVEGEWKKVAETSGEKTVASANMQIFKAEIRVRAYNVGSREPGPWSESWTIQDEATEKDLEDARYREKLEFTLASNRAKRKLLGRAASAKLQQAVTSEEGVAVITSTADDDKLGRKFHQWKASDKMGAEWTPFARVIGEFFLEAGVEGGVDGTLFDLRAQQVRRRTPRPRACAMACGWLASGGARPAWRHELLHVAARSAWEMRGRCVGDAWDMRGRYVGDAWEMRGRCGAPCVGATAHDTPPRSHTTLRWRSSTRMRRRRLQTSRSLASGRTSRSSRWRPPGSG